MSYSHSSTRSKLISSGLKKFNNWLSLSKLDKKQYQEDGVKFLLEREYDDEPYRGCRGGIIADEMGLGKTIMTLGLILTHQVKHTLIVVPTALLGQWETEIMRLLGHTPFVYHGNNKKTKTLDESPVVITTYGTLSGSFGENPLTRFRWSRVIYDEAHRLRNMSTKAHKSAVSLNTTYTWCLTGTPIQNKMFDLISLCHILQINDAGNLDIHDMDWLISRFVIKRTKADVGIDLIPIIEKNITVDWKTDEETNMACDLHSTLGFTGVTMGNVNKIINLLSSSTLPSLIRMRQMCILPKTMSTAVEKLVRTGMLDEDDVSQGIEGTSKMDAVIKQVSENRDNGEKKIIFTHFKMEMSYLRSKLSEELGLNVACIEGATSYSDREEYVTSMEYDVLILQINSACEGLNLQHYTEVYFTSPHWNPSVEAQAIARAHRIGQKKQVKVYRFIMNGFGHDTKSIEQYILEIQDMKKEWMKIFNKS
jgi:transcription termination factor 2